MYQQQSQAPKPRSGTQPPNARQTALEFSQKILYALVPERHIGIHPVCEGAYGHNQTVLESVPPNFKIRLPLQADINSSTGFDAMIIRSTSE